jgi:hypothetical protein
MGKKQFPDQHLEMAGKKYLENMIVMVVLMEQSSRNGSVTIW